jgi:hypothetical protein
LYNVAVLSLTKNVTCVDEVLSQFTVTGFAEFNAEATAQ